MASEFYIRGPSASSTGAAPGWMSSCISITTWKGTPSKTPRRSSRSLLRKESRRDQHTPEPRPVLRRMALRSGAPRRAHRRTLPPTTRAAGSSSPLADLGHRRAHRRGPPLLAVPGLQRARRRTHAFHRSRRRWLGRRPRSPASGGRARLRAAVDLDDRRGLSRPVDAGDAPGGIPSRARRPDPDPHASGRAHASPHARRLPHWRDHPDTRHAWAEGDLHLDQPDGDAVDAGLTVEEYGKAGIRTRGAETPAQALSRRSHSTTLPPPRGGGSQFTLFPWKLPSMNNGPAMGAR